MADLSTLLKALNDEALAKQAEVTAAQTQLSALQQTHAQTLSQVDKLKKQLTDGNTAVAGAEGQVQKILQQARAQAGAIVNEADKMNREASAVLAAAEQNAEQIITAARAQAKKIVEVVANKAQELHDANNELNITQSKSKALKKQALDFGNS